ncbi:hypothetical protein KGP36_02610 [Patescibacteria group bacterium]|nr:hypothetical protein [Patescibacteria group bacterium]
MANAVRGLTTGMLIVAQAASRGSGLAYNGILTKASPGIGRPSARLESIVCGREYEVFGSEDFTQGNPATPCLRLDSFGKWRFRWAMGIGQHIISVNVLHAINQNPRPSMVIKANPAIGINADIETFAPSGTGWVTINSPTFTTTAVGVTWVELRNNLVTNVGFSPCYFDHIVKS